MNLGGFFERNKVFIAIIIAGLIIAGAVYFSNQKRGEFSSNQPVGGLAEDCQNIPELADNASKLVTKIIDGDTFLIEGGYSIRILGIDADERDQLCYEPAKEKLEQLILNKEVRLEQANEDKDQWCRYLRYVFLNFEKAYPSQCFTGVIFSSDLYKFVQNPEDYYSGKIVRIMGEVKEYQGRPEIILENPSQIEIGK